MPKLTVVTQNVDDLHERAGSQVVIHLHDSLHSPRFLDCGQAYTLPLTTSALPEDGSRIEPPRCSGCNGYLRPGVVWFGEMLPDEAWSAGLAAADECDVFLSIGTSGIVYPAAGLSLRASGHGATVVHINPVRFDISGREHFLQGPASVLMQGLLSEAFGDLSAQYLDSYSHRFCFGLDPCRGAAVVNQTLSSPVLAPWASILKPLAHRGPARSACARSLPCKKTGAAY